MINRDLNRPLCAAALVAGILVSSVPLAGNQVSAKEKIDIELESAPLRETLQSFAAIAGADFQMPEDVEGAVSVDFRSTPWPTALDQICRDQGLNCEMLAGEPPVLRVRRVEADAAYPLPPGFAEPINLSLLGADLKVVLQTFGEISSLEFRIADDVAGEVNLNVQSTPWSLVLIEVCRLSGCRVIWGEEVVEIVREEAEAETTPLLDLSLAGADLRQTLSFFAKVPILGATETVVEIDPAVAGSVTVELTRVTWQQAFDLICADAGCDWRLDYGDPPVLRVMPRGSEGARFDSKMKEPAAAAKTLAFRFVPPGGSPVAGTVAFTWAEPIHVLSSEGPYQARLSWIPFGSELSVVLPLVERCDEVQSSVVLLDPIVLPLAEELRYQAEGATLELSPAASEAPGSRPPSKRAAACGPDREGVVQVTVRRFLDTESDRPRAKRRSTLESYLLVRPVDARRPVAAVISLGSDLDGRQSLALLEPGEGGLGVEIETLSLALGERMEKIVRSDGRPFELRIEYLKEAAKK